MQTTLLNFDKIEQYVVAALAGICYLAQTCFLISISVGL